MTKTAGYKIIFEDDFILVADKPAGMLTVPTPKKERHTLSSLLNAYPGHRLDRETSGLILFAKNRRIQQALMDAFKEKRGKKRYIALVQGKLKRKNAVISRLVQDNPYEPGKHAITQYRLLEERAGFSVVEVIPLTGRTNQIRIHFKQIGHPLVGERRFAFAKDFPIKFRRTALHSANLEFEHPVTGKKMSFHCDLPMDMQSFLDAHK